uniref:Putative conserved plasma membrane protein n=1 Tax=Amblyomma aureolatum TaxID=187763 RepID=A0A1E1X1U3_9ACAR
MYCLQWLIPVLLIPKPMNLALVQNHVMFMVLSLTGFFLERKPCTICSLVFIAAVFLICYSGMGNCIFSLFVNCNSVTCEPGT